MFGIAKVFGEIFKKKIFFFIFGFLYFVKGIALLGKTSNKAMVFVTQLKNWHIFIEKLSEI